MKTLFLILAASAQMMDSSKEPPALCAAPVTGASGAAPAACDHAISTKGTGATGRSAAADHAINTKGTGAAGRAAPGPGGDCDDASAASDRKLAAAPAVRACAAGSSDPDQGCGDSAAVGAMQPPKTQMAIKCKGTGAQ